MQRLLLHQQSRYSEISVYETDELYGERGLFRVLQFASEAVQGAMDMNRPERIILEYPRAMLHLLQHQVPLLDRVFIIGQGAGTLASHLSGCGVIVAEIDPLVAEISRTYFGYTGDSVRIGDGRSLLEEEKPGSLDGIIIDAFSEQGTPAHLTSLGFFRLAAERLDPEGLLLLNVFGRGANDAWMAAIATTLREVLNEVRVFSLPPELPHEPRNMMIAGSRKPIQYQAHGLAGFAEVELRPGYIIHDIPF
ncbi:MAG: fused MFS/spermidine synthase [Paenibacillus sp.]|uniref:spermidine synthase n=1 Tax=Paenibacillus sp. TaxID=58172 RepID=UPI00290DEDFC|nr:fused MFS/spermidine synthase [Paenibacillus sp.]MDU4698610.1 fused MFS/spermidine synthase [Paenibacillus sp.]